MRRYRTDDRRTLPRPARPKADDDGYHLAKKRQGESFARLGFFNLAAPLARHFGAETGKFCRLYRFASSLYPSTGLVDSDSETSRHYRASVPQAFLPA